MLHVRPPACLLACLPGLLFCLQAALAKEVHWLTSLNHPNLVRFCAVCLERPLVVMEFYKVRSSPLIAITTVVSQNGSWQAADSAACSTRSLDTCDPAADPAATACLDCCRRLAFTLQGILLPAATADYGCACCCYVVAVLLLLQQHGSVFAMLQKAARELARSQQARRKGVSAGLCPATSSADCSSKPASQLFTQPALCSV